MSRKNKQYVFGAQMRKDLLLQRDTSIESLADDILVKNHEKELKKKYPDATLSELKNNARNKYKKEQKALNNLIAPFYHDKVSDIIGLTSNFNIVTNKNKFSSKPSVLRQPGLEDVYQSMNLKTDFFDVLEKFSTSAMGTNKIHVGNQLIAEAIAFDKINYMNTGVKASQTLTRFNTSKNFFDQANKFLVFDFETMGGINEYGYKKVNHMTEFAYGIFDKSKNGFANKVETINGLTKSQADEFLKLVQDVPDLSKVSNEQAVTFRRLGLYGHANTKLAKNADGLYSVAMADVANDYVFSLDEINRGIANLSKVYEDQAKIQTTSGLSIVQERFADMLKAMNDKSIAKVGYNTTAADIPWMNHFLASNSLGLTDSQKDLFLKRSGLSSMAINTADSDWMDLITPTRYASSNVGSADYYRTAAAKEAAKSGSPFAQETLTRAYFPNAYANQAAHSAGFDIERLADLLVNPNAEGLNGETFLQKVSKDANLNLSKNKGMVNTQGLDLFLANESSKYWSGGNAPISYVFDPLNKQYRTGNQYLFGDNGIGKDLISESHIKRNRMYTIDFAGQLNMQDEWVKNLNGIHDDLAQKNLFALKLSPYSDEAITGAHQSTKGHTVMFFRTQDEMEAAISNLTHVGTRNSTKSKFTALSGEAGKEVERLFGEYKITKDGIKEAGGKFDLDRLVSETTRRDMNDSAARMIRDNDWTKALNFNQFYNTLSEFTGEKEVSSKTANSVMLQLLQSQDRQLSKTVASGKTISISFNDVQNALGWKNGEVNNLMANTFDNQIVAFNYMKSQLPISNAVINELDESLSTNVKKFRYNHIMNSLIEDKIADLSENDPDKFKQLWFNSTPQNVYNKDLNYFNFNLENTTDPVTSKVYGYKKPTIDDDILRVNLDPGKQYQLRDNLLHRYVPNYKSLNPYQKEQEQITQLKSFVNNIRSSNTHQGLFSDLTEEKINELSTSEMLSQEIINSIRSYRQNNPTAGYITESWTQNPQMRSIVMEELAKDANISDRIKIASKNLPEYMELGIGESADDIARNIIDNILVDKIDDPFKFAKNAGATDIQAKYFNELYGQTKNEYTAFMSDFISNFTKADDVSFVFNKKQNQFALMKGNDAINLDFARIKTMDNNMFIDLNGNKIALHSKLDARKFLNGNPEHMDFSKVNFISTLGDAFNQSISVNSVAQQGNTKGDILYRARSYMQNVNSYITQGSAISANDILDIQTPYRIDLTDLYGLSSLAEKDKYLNGRTFRDPNLREVLSRKGKYNLRFNNTNTMERETIQKNIPELLRMISDNRGGDNSIFGLIASGYTSYGKETQVSEGIGQIDIMQHRPGIQWDNNGRPVINQTRTALYKKSEWEQASKSNYFKDLVSLNGVTSNDFTLANDNRHLLGVGETIDKLSVRKANVSEIDFKNAISERFLLSKSEKEKKIYNRLKSVNLTEQEQLINARIMDTFYNKAHYQKINSKKELAFYMEINQNTIKEANELKKIAPSFEMVDGKVVFKYGKKVEKSAHETLLSIQGFSGGYTQTSKIEGQFGFGYFSKTDGMFIPEQSINSMIKDKTKDQAKEYLDNMFDSAWYVKSIDQKNYKKILQGYVEKGMATGYYGGLGEFDESINAYVKEVRGSQKLGDLRGRVLSRDFLEEEIIGRYNSKIGGKYNIKDKDDFKKRIYDERYAIQNEIDSIFGKVGIFSNHGQKGHANSQLAFEELVQNMRASRVESGQTEQEAMEAIYKELVDSKAINVPGLTYNASTGTIHYPMQVKDGSYYDNEKIASVLNNNAVYKGLAEGKDIIYNGKNLGKYSNTMISEAYSYQGISGRTSENYLSALTTIDEKINNTTSYAQKAALEQERAGIARSYRFTTKGQKITERELQLLNMQSYDDDFINRAYQGMKGMTDAKGNSLFERTYGHVLQKDTNGNFIKNNEQYALDPASRGRSMLKNYTDDILNTFVLGDETSRVLNKNTDLKALYDDQSVREGIGKIINYKGEISKDTAENIYAYTRGNLATSYNVDKHLMSLEGLQKEGFQVKNAGEIYRTFKHGEDSLKHADSIFNKNMLIDLGQSLGSERYVAVPYAPSALSGDVVIRNNFQKSLFGMLSAHDNVQAFDTNNYDGKYNRDELVERLRKKRRDLVSEIDLFTTGKNGVGGEFHVRQQGSVTGVTSSAVVVDPTQMTGAAKQAINETWEKQLKLFNNNEIEALINMNAPSLSQSMFDGQSILQHYHDRRYINTRWSGIQQFEELGMFNQEYMKSIGINNREEMMQKLRTEGVLTNTIRTPSIYVDSTSPTMMYLDDTLKGNQTKLLMEGQFSLNGDNDADMVSSSLWRLNGKDSLQATHSGEIGNRGWLDTKANMLYRGTTGGKFWHNKTVETLTEDYLKARENSNYFSLTANKTLDNKIYSAFGLNPGMKAVEQNTSILDEFNAIYNQQIGESFVSTNKNALDKAQALLDGMDAAAAERYRKAIIFDSSFGASEIAGQSKVRKRAIGEINNSLFKLRQASDMVYNSATDSKSKYLIQLVSENVEQEVISSKKGNLRTEIARTEEFNKALRNLLSGTDNQISQGRMEMKRWMKGDNAGMYSRLEKSIEQMRDIGYIKTGETLTADSLIDNFVNDVSTIGKTEYNKLKSMDGLFTKMQATSYDNLRQNYNNLAYVSKREASIKSEVMDIAIGSGNMSAAQLTNETLNKQALKEINNKAAQSFNDGVAKSDVAQSAIRTTLKDTMNGMHKGIQELASSKLGLASIGLAAAYMITGYMGNNASQPNDMQAQQMTEQYGDPQLNDMQYRQSNTSSGPNGYVVNIKANGNPNAINRSQQSLNQSIYQSMNSNVDIRMNITDSNGNINDRYLDQLLSNAIQ